MYQTDTLADVMTQEPAGPADSRRKIVEAGTYLPNGKYFRTSTITTTADPQDPTALIRLGDHWHPETECFTVVAGGGKLYTAMRDEPHKITCQTFVAGQMIVIPAGVVHTFMCLPGTTLVACVDWPFSEAMINRERLDLSNAG